MNDIQSYEKIIKRRVSDKLLFARIGLIFSYILFAVIGVLLSILIADGHPALLLLVVILDFCLFLTTWRLVNIEYEYAFTSGSFYLSKILGKSTRREIFESEISRAVTIAPYEGHYKLDAQRQEPQKIICAISSKKAADIWFMLFEGESGIKSMIIFEADERALKCLKHYNPRAIAREKLTQGQHTTEDITNA